MNARWIIFLIALIIAGCATDPCVGYDKEHGWHDCTGEVDNSRDYGRTGQ